MNQNLTYRSLTPREGAPPYPLLVILHGRGADEHDLLGIAQALDPRFYVLSVRAPLPILSGYAWYRNLQSGVPDPNDLRQGVELIQALVEERLGAGTIDLGRLFALGFSQGAAMVGGLLLTGTVSLRGAVMLSGFLPADSGLTAPAGAVSGRHVFIGHGEHDDLIPAEFGDDARDILADGGALVSHRRYPIGHQISEQELRDVDAWLRQRLDE